jgi:CubicO group peptidase (beta-lactamase class C family)
MMQLVRQGVIRSLDDNVWMYSFDSNASDSTADYRRCLPRGYPDMSIRRIMRHMAGLPGPNPANIWTTFPSGTLRVSSSNYGRYYYSTTGFSIIGDVMEDATGRTYQQLVHQYLRDNNPLHPTGLTTRYAVRADYSQPYTNLSWQTPSTYIRSTILDLAKFAAGVMNGDYITEIEANEMFDQGIGWKANYTIYNGRTYPCFYHTGDNGVANRAICIIDRVNDIAAVVLYSGSSTSIREAWAKALMNVMYRNQ